MQRLSREAFIRFSNVLLQRIRGLKVSNKRIFFRKLAKTPFIGSARRMSAWCVLLGWCASREDSACGDVELCSGVVCDDAVRAKCAACDSAAHTMRKGAVVCESILACVMRLRYARNRN